MDRYFEFNNIKSIDMNYSVVYFPQDYYNRLSYGGRNVDTFLNSRPIIEENELQFSIVIAKMDKKGSLLEFTKTDLSDLGRWLIQDEYKEIRFSDDMDKVYYVMLTDMSELQLDRADKGFIELTFKSYTSSAFTNKRIETLFVDDSKDIEVFAEHILEQYYYPTIRITAFEDTDFKLTNKATGQVVEVKDIKKDEIIEIDNALQVVRSNDKLSNPFSRFNREWLYYRKGSNLLNVQGKVNIELESQYPIL